MSKQTKVKRGFSSLLDPALKLKTPLNLEELPKAERTLVEHKLNETLRKEVDKIRDEITRLIPGRETAINKLFANPPGLPIDKAGGLSLGEVMMNSVREEDKAGFDTEEMEKIKLYIEANSATLNDVLSLDKPLHEHPLLRKEFSKAKLSAIAEIAGISGEKAARFVSLETNITGIDEDALETVVRNLGLTKTQKQDLFLVSQLNTLVGDNISLISSVKDSGIATSFDLVKWESADWLTLISKNKLPLPQGEVSAESYAVNLKEIVETSFPTEFFMHRVISNSVTDATSGILKKINPLIKNDLSFFTGYTNESTLPEKSLLQELDSNAKKELLQNLDTLRPFINNYRYLEISEIIGKKGSVQQKQQEITGRIEALNKFYENNAADIDLSNTDFTGSLDVKEDGLNWKGVEPRHRQMIKKQFASFQRAFVLGENQEVSSQLLKAGFDSALRIVSLSEEDFIASSKLGTENGRRVYKKALDLSIGSAHYMEAIRSGIKSVFNDFTVANQHPLVNDLREIDGFDKLFGSQDYCDCEHCRSIFSPAAYFTDLMYFVQENVSKKVFTGTKSNHPLYLRRRRPDLWTLTLSCANTNTEIPYLQVVNAVLEKYLQSELNVTNVYNFLKNADWSIHQPFHLELEELRLYLSHFDIRLYDIYRDMDLDAASLQRERMKMAPEELAIITTPDATAAKKRFRNKPLANFAVKDFISYAGISRSQLDELLKCKSFPQIAQVSVKKIKDPSDIQKYSEELQNLTDTRLDIIHRYLRTWKKTGWNLKEFDLLLNALKSAGLITSLESTHASGDFKILQLAQMMNFQEQLNLTVEELATIVFELPQETLIKDQKSFAERAFDLAKINDNTIPDKTPFVLAGLGISEADLNLLTAALAVDLTQPVDLATLSFLFRHVRLAKSLKFSIEDFLGAATLMLNGQPVKKFSDIEKLIEFNTWLRKSRFKLADLVFILEGTESSQRKFKSTRDSLTEKLFSIDQLEIIQTETDPVIKLDKKKALLLDYLQSTFNLTALQLNTEFIPLLLTGNFNLAANKALNATFTAGLPDNPADFDDLVSFMNQLERYTLLFTSHFYTAETITWIIQNAAVFGINNLKHLTLEQVQDLSFYHSLYKDNEELESDLQKLLVDFQATSTFAGHESTLAALWQQPESLVKSVINQLVLTTPAIDAVRDIWTVLKTCILMGIQGDSFLLLIQNDFKKAASVALGAFASKYDDEKIRKDKLEPYADKLNTLKRDALCDYIISRYDKFKFKDRHDLYAFFLLDVEMSGCFRTSWLVAAITSLQLYVYRCLTNLEQSEPNLNPGIPDIKVAPTLIPADEWEWRKNYRVWEANRKVFLYPENYIDPTLRDTKTHIFKELEDELLQQKITIESAEMAYKKYMSQFGELTRLRMAGAYYEQVLDNYGYYNLDNNNATAYFMVTAIYFPSEQDDSLYYLFGRTNVMPYQYFYRTYNHSRKTWGNWNKIELGIEAKEISALIFRGRLYIFWTEVKSKEMNKVGGGNATSDGHVFNTYVKYAYLTENGKWSAPQRIWLGQAYDTNQKIYGRARNTSFFDTARWEKEKDAIVEAYQEKVFRKPYTYQQVNDIATPIRMGLIWSNNKGSSVVTYASQAISFNISVLSFSVPSRSFTISNNDFSGATANININVRLKLPLITSTKSFPCIIQMLPGVCLLTGVFFGFPVCVPLPFSVNVAALPVKESFFNLSISRNLITNPKEQNLFTQSSNISNYLKEYNVAYYENGHMFTHFEDGTKSMSSHRISQDGNGMGGIHIPRQNSYDFVSFNTILTDEITDVLYAKGVEHFLSLTTQEMTDQYGRKFDLRGPYGEYYWEIYFHIPFLIANHFNANQKFKEAKWWYERIFNPTSDELPGNSNPTDHNWQFREFRGLTPQKLKDILTDVKAIEAYKKDPFDPHAIARLRISAYQKTIVMRYIDNLLDWGDYLFTQDTRESINEAEMLYHLAYNILGKKPVKMGACDTVNENTLTYALLAPEIGKGTEFLITLENYYVVQKKAYEQEVGFVKQSKHLSVFTEPVEAGVDFRTLQKKVEIQRLTDLSINLTSSTRNSDSANRKTHNLKNYDVYVSEKQRYKERNAGWYAEKERSRAEVTDRLKFKKQKRYPAVELVKQSGIVFCVPENKDLLAYWTRVEDRLFKIWNCMNIKGIRRSLSLFQPPIDPMMLVRLRAAGLSIEDVVAMVLSANQVPNYRFTYLLEKAKQFTQTVQSFGTSLLGALEKKDTEELLLLRTVHEKNILKLTKEVKKKQVKEALAQFKSMEETLLNVQNRVDHYSQLVDEGLTPWEIAEQVSKWTASGIRIAEATMGFLASVFGFLPQVGSPFAMKYGGQELKNGTKSLANATGTLAAIADNIAILAGLEAGHQRREQEWKHQLKLAQQEIKQVTQQQLAAEIRHQITEKDLEIHERNMEQLDELNDFYKNKFTNLGLYQFLASSLNRLYRSAYNLAYDLAKLAERAYQFERFDSSIFIQGDNWQFDKAGLLAGERLQLQLLELEKKYLESHERSPEITQSFSLALLDASQLIALRQTGSCNFNIPKVAFAVVYPGQFRLIIKSVRVSIPAVAGPYTNISARLTLLKGEVEENENDALTEIGIAKNTSISTSSANNDAGVFNLDFRDDRYLPFEGAGAISQWRLELPSLMRSFNYDSIADVVLHFSYTAIDGDRAAAENGLAAMLTLHATTNGLYRLFSLRFDFPGEFNLLEQGSQSVELTIDKIHFPYLFIDKDLIIVETTLFIKPNRGKSVSIPSGMKLNNTTLSPSAGNDLALPGASGSTGKIKAATANLSGGDPVKKWTFNMGSNTLDTDLVDDILISVKYKI
jgi:hypothetical protein